MSKCLLIITPWIPYPITGADQQDRFEGFKQLKNLGYDLHIIAKIHAFQNKAEIERFYADAGLPLTLVPYTTSHALLVGRRLLRILAEPALLDGAALEYTDPLMEQTIRDAVASFKPDCAWVEFSFLWPVVTLLKSLGIPSVMRSANNEAQQSIDEHGGSVAARLLAIPRFRGERLAARESAHLCAITPWEETWYRQCGATRVSVLPLRGLPRVLRQRTHTDKKMIDVVFLSSSYTNGHNRDALKFLLTRIIPTFALATAGKPVFHFHITGKKFPAAYRQYLTPAVTVHDFIEDLDTFLDTMDCALCPSVSGQGMQQKIFEPLCIGLPLITHHTAGYPFEDGKQVLLAKDEGGYVRHLLSLCNTTRRQQLADAAYQLSQTLFSKERLEYIARTAIDDAEASIEDRFASPPAPLRAGYVPTGEGRSTISRIARYLFSGVLANGVDIGLYLLLIWGGVYFVTASLAGNVFGFFASFYLHKYVSFEAQGESAIHMVRYIVVTILNLLAQLVILYVCVQLLGIWESWAKVIANGSVVVWNFFLYQIFVYRLKK